MIVIRALGVMEAPQLQIWRRLLSTCLNKAASRAQTALSLVGAGNEKHFFVSSLAAVALGF